jgi:hypothetical protein
MMLYFWLASLAMSFTEKDLHRLYVSSSPGGALSASGVDQSKCRKYKVGSTSKGESIYTCNVCQRVCPNVFG